MNKLCLPRLFGSLLIALCALPVLAQKGEKPIIVRRVKPETAHDARLVSAIVSALGAVELDAVRYHYNKVDLNGDGRPEVLVFIFGPTMCGTSGCDAMVFQSLGRSGYKLITNFGPARNPIIVIGRRSHGWNDLIMPVAGGGIQPGYYAVLHFDGRTYPENPTIEPAGLLGRRLKGTAYVVGSYAPDAGMALHAGRKNGSAMSINR
jgi:hypothetical protein